jgi:hypothetical protein
MTITPTRPPDLRTDHPQLHAILDGQWQTDAACAGTPPTQANWFPDQGGGSATHPRTREAIRICGTCPVNRQCLLYALINDRAADRGIYGGKTAKQRTAIRTDMIARGVLPVVRICGNPACRRRFIADSRHQRRDALCSRECRLARRRLLARSAKLNGLPGGAVTHVS